MSHSVFVHTVPQNEQDADNGIPAVETLLCDESAVPDDLEDPVPGPGHSALPEMSMEDWHRLQREDAALL